MAKSLKEFWDDVITAKTWYEAIWNFVIGKDISVESFIDALSFVAVGYTPLKAGITAAAKFGSEIGTAIEEFLIISGPAAENAIIKSAAMLKSPTLISGIKISNTFTKTITRLSPYRIADIVGDLTGKNAYNLAKKGIDDLVKNIIAPSFTWLDDIKIVLNKYVEAVTGSLTRFKVWQTSIVSWQKLFVGASFTSLLNIVSLLQGQIDKIILTRLSILETSVRAIQSEIPVKIAAMESKITSLLSKNILVINEICIKHYGELILFKNETLGKFTKVNIDFLWTKTELIRSNADVSRLNKIVNDLPAKSANYTDSAINKSWNDKMETPTDKQLSDDIDNMMKMSGWLPAKIIKIYTPIMPKIIEAIGRGYDMYG